MKNMVFTEAYRPIKVSMMVGNFKDKILEYLKNPKALPNFLLYSRTPGTGKCLSKNEIFFTEKGMMSFEDYIPIKNEKLYDVEQKKFVDSIYYYKSKADTISIKTTKGYDICGTRNHKIKVFDINEGFIWKRLDEIKKDDIIPLFFNTKLFGNDNKIYSYEKKQRPEIKEIKVPLEINSDIAYFLGVFLANGTIDKNNLIISSQKRWLYDKIMKILYDNFGIQKMAFVNNAGFHCGGLRLKEFLELGCGYKKNIARYKSIPKKIMECSEDIQMSFLNGLFEDSSFSKKEERIQYSSSSKKLIKEVQLMLLNLGYITSKKIKRVKGYDWDYYHLNICAEHTRKFINYFGGYYKNNKINFLRKKNTNMLTYGNIIYDFILYKRNGKKIGDKKLWLRGMNKLGINRCKLKLSKYINAEPYLKQLQMFIDNDIFLDKINYIKKDKKQNIYDFHIPKTHSFLASGIINHNTTLGMAIVRELGCDYLLLNSSDDRNIETVREKIKDFAMTKGSNPGLKRAIFCDEFDGMTRVAQEALRNIMEIYSSNCFFILTCNNINKVIQPIQNRCQLIPFSHPDKEEIKVYLEYICQKENIDYDDDGLNFLIETNYPSIRNCVIILQDLKTQGKGVFKENITPINEIFIDMWNKLMQKEWKEIKETVLKQSIDVRELNTFFWQRGVEEGNLKIVQICCRNEKDFALGSDEVIIFVTSLIELVK